MTTRKSARIATRNTRLEDGRCASQQNGVADATDSLSGDAAFPSDSDPQLSDTEPEASRPAKRRRTQSKSNRPNRTATRHPRQSLSSTATAIAPTSPARPPLQAPCHDRTHPPTYHNPLLLTSPSARLALLTWFDTAFSARSMPWRKPFQPPSTLSRAALARRAYEVWISEVMLQQTRVAVVVGYWTRWMARWPTMRDLAAASEEEVVGMWTGLGYYSRARRVWQAARVVCGGDGDGDQEEMAGLLPGDVEGLMRLPGVGRYTAGAVASIVFGVPAAVVDGNVLRVLSRQMGVLGDAKGDKAVVGLLWDAAGELVSAVAGDGEVGEGGVSDRPGRWGQALMELGSTVCTPKPNCAVCPITGTCRAYAEGMALAENRPAVEPVGDIEDVCTLCAPFDEAAEGQDEVELDKEAKKEPITREGRLSRFFATTPAAETPGPDACTLGTIIQHTRKFPLRKPKKKVREEETLVCAIRRASDGSYLIHQRPDKGLLGGLWELPSHTLPKTNDSTVKTRKANALSYAASLIPQKDKGSKSGRPSLKHAGELESVPWLFSHLKLTMHVHLFEMDDTGDLPACGVRERWASAKDIDSESMGTGMKKCWSLVKETTA